jgi:hypothetical protein
MTTPYDVGRGSTATADMKARIEALKGSGADVLDALWERNRRAVSGEGYHYEFAQDRADPVRSPR